MTKTFEIKGNLNDGYVAEIKDDEDGSVERFTKFQLIAMLRDVHDPFDPTPNSEDAPLWREALLAIEDRHDKDLVSMMGSERRPLEGIG